MPSSMNSWLKGIYNHPFHPMHRPSSLSKRRTTSYDQYKIIVLSINRWCVTNTPCLSSLHSYKTWGEHSFIQNWTFAGATTTYKLKMVTNGRRRSKLEGD